MTIREDISETLEAIAFDVRDGNITKEELKSSLEAIARAAEEVDDQCGGLI